MTLHLMFLAASSVAIPLVIVVMAPCSEQGVEVEHEKLLGFCSNRVTESLKCKTQHHAFIVSHAAMFKF